VGVLPSGGAKLLCLPRHSISLWHIVVPPYIRNGPL
jgi:hypothetical protein